MIFWLILDLHTFAQSPCEHGRSMASGRPPSRSFRSLANVEDGTVCFAGLSSVGQSRCKCAFGAITEWERGVSDRKCFDAPIGNPRNSTAPAQSLLNPRVALPQPTLPPALGREDLRRCGPLAVSLRQRSGQFSKSDVHHARASDIWTARCRGPLDFFIDFGFTYACAKPLRIWWL